MKLFLLNLGRGSVVRAQLCPSATLITTRMSRSRANTWLMRLSLAYSILIASSIQLLARTTSGQTIDKELVTIELQNDNLVAMVKKIEAQSTLRFIYLPEQLSKYGEVSLVRAKRSVKETLDLVLAGTGLSYEQSGKYVVLKERVEAAAVPVAVEREAIASIVSGTVKDQDGLTLAGVSVVVKGSTRGTTTDAEGRFAIEVDTQDDVLVFSFIGFKPMEVKVGGQSDIKVALESDITSLREVQVVGTTYWSSSKRQSTSNITKITSNEIGKQPVTSPLMALQGRVPGMDITPTSGVAGSSVNIQIRGRNSIRSNTGYPLYIVDGMPINSQPLESNNSNLLKGAGIDPLSTINPENIESIEILKDADATAIYGSRGANGVIIITTKNNSKGDKTNFDVSAYQGLGQVSHYMDLLSREDYITMRKEAYKNAGETPTSGGAPDLLVWDTTRYTDWQRELFGKTAKISSIQGNLTGGNKNTNFALGGAYRKETMVFPGDFGQSKITGNLNLGHTSFNGKFKITLAANYGIQKNKLFTDTDLVGEALALAPVAPKLYEDNGNLNWENSTWINPLSNLKKTNNINGDNLIVSSNIAYEVLPHLVIKSNIGFNKATQDEIIKFPLSSLNPSTLTTYSTARSQFGNSNRNSWIAEPQISYNVTSTKHNLQFLIGSTWQRSTSSYQLVEASGYTSDVLLESLQGATSTNYIKDSSIDYRYNSFFMRAGYNFKEKYFLNLTARRDGSSRFGPKNKFGNFGAIGAAWIFSNEKFFANNIGVLSFGKIRASYGTTGNDQIGDYSYLSTYGYSLKYQNTVGLNPSALYNPQYQWEVTRKLELAIELGILNDRINAEISFYRNRSSNQLLNYSLPGTTGFSSLLTNFDAIVENRGLELAIRSTNITSNTFSWSTSLNVTVPRNKLVSYPGIESTSYGNTYVVGKSLNIAKTYNYKGVNSQTGLYEVTDVNGDGTYDNFDRTFVQDIGRQVYGGVNNTIQYKRFELSFLFQFSKQTSFIPIPLAGFMGNQSKDVMNRWRSEGDIAKYQQFSTSYLVFSPYLNAINSNAPYYSNSFVRLKTISLSYTISKNLLDKARIKSCRIFLQGQNLFTVTKFNQLDPETGNNLPPLRMITAGLDIKL